MTDSTPVHTVFIETFGCQMNVLDSELVLGALGRSGYAPVEDPERADLILLNTCSVRQRAEDKVYSRLGELRRIKWRRPETILGVIGCMAEHQAETICSRAPHVDLICGPGELGKLVEWIERIRGGDRPVVQVTRDGSRRRPASDRHADDELEALDRFRRPIEGERPIQAFIRVQRGCDKFCSYCVVPFVRGPERSRPPAHIVEEARALAESGVVQITLLGQSINSYAHAEDGRIVRLPELLERVHRIEGIRRLRFITSFPGDFDESILRAMRDLPRVCEYLHLPVQSGSNRILAAMRRDHTVEDYLALVERARQLIPNLSLAGDFIVGFPGETEEDFRASCDVVRRVQYKNIFVFKYSPRPGTAAARNLPDNVPPHVKRRRNMELLAIQSEIALSHNRSLIGQCVEVLVEGPSKAATKARRTTETTPAKRAWFENGDRHLAGTRFLGRSRGLARSQSPFSNHAAKRPTYPSPTQMTGRTRGDQIVVFEGGPDLVGNLIRVRITSATDLTLHGQVEGPE